MSRSLLKAPRVIADTLTTLVAQAKAAAPGPIGGIRQGDLALATETGVAIQYGGPGPFDPLGGKLAFADTAAGIATTTVHVINLLTPGSYMFEVDLVATESTAGATHNTTGAWFRVTGGFIVNDDGSVHVLGSAAVTIGGATGAWGATTVAFVLGGAGSPTVTTQVTTAAGAPTAHWTTCFYVRAFIPNP
jgi:hypothetical protein